MTHIAHGWQCPQCRGIYAPTIPQCTSCPQLSPRDQHKMHADLDRAYREFLETRAGFRLPNPTPPKPPWPHPDGFAGGLSERGE